MTVGADRGPAESANHLFLQRQKPAESDQKKGEDKQAKEETLRMLIDKVLAAHGGEDKLNKLASFTMTVKHSNGETQHYFVQPPRHFRHVVRARTGAPKSRTRLDDPLCGQKIAPARCSPPIYPD